MYYKQGNEVSICRVNRKSDTVQAYVRHTDTASRRRAHIDEYLTEMNRAPPKVAMAARDECPRCDDAPRLYCARIGPS